MPLYVGDFRFVYLTDTYTRCLHKLVTVYAPATMDL